MVCDRQITWIRSRWRPLLLWGGGLLLSLVLFTVLVLPTIIKSQVEKGLHKATGRAASIASVSFNPFGMTLTVRGFKLMDQAGGTPFLQCDQLQASLSSGSFFRFAPVVDHLLLDGLQATLVRTAPNRYNFSDIFDRMAAQPKKKADKPLRFSINDILLQRGSIDFDDRAVPGGRLHTVKDIQLSVPFISTIPHLAEKCTDPTFKAVVNGAPFSFHGTSKPLHKSMETDLQLKLTNIDLLHYLPYLPGYLPFRLESGIAGIDMQLAYKIHQNSKPELVLKGLANVDKLIIKEKNGTPFGNLKRFELQARGIDLFNRRYDLQQLTFDGLKLYLERGTGGVWNTTRLFSSDSSQPKPAKETANKKAAEPLQLLVETLAINDSILQYADKVVAGGFALQLNKLNAKLGNLTLKPEDQSPFELTATGDKGEALALSGSMGFSPFSISTTYRLADFGLERLWPYLQTSMASPLKGKLTMEGKTAWSSKNGTAVDDLNLHITNLAARYGTNEETRLTTLDLNGIMYHQQENLAGLDELLLSKGSINLSRELNGSISLTSLFKPATAPAGAKQPSTAAAKPKSTTTKDADTRKQPMRWEIKKINTDQLTVTFNDKTFDPVQRFQLKNIRLATGNLTGPVYSAMPLAFSASYGGTVPLKANGSITPKPFKYAGSLSLSRMPLQDFQAYLPENVNFYLLGGTLDSNLRLNLAQKKDGTIGGSFSGNSGLRGFHAIDLVEEEDLLKWDSLQLDRMSGTLAPFSLAIREIALNDVFSKIIIRKDKSINLQNLVAKPQDDAPASAAAPAQATADLKPHPAVPAQTKGKITIDAVTVQNGTIDFTDEHMNNRFKTTFYRLGGRISGLSSDMNTKADVDLRGNLENHSPLQISGTINPLRDDLFVDLTITFRDIELAPATPYSGTYLGYEIDKGKLYLDMKYHIENRSLEATNKVFVDQFTFGKTVESDKATKLPVRLGVALLKDRNGEIHLDVPVTGRTDDPKFSVVGLVWKVLTNLLVKAVTSPFALLSSMFGSGEDLSSVSFAPGSAVLTPTEEKKLAALATALAQRPSLKVELAGYVDPKRDPEGYRAELLLQKMRQEKFLDLAKKRQTREGDSGASMVILPEEESRYLKAVYSKEKFPKPRNLIGMQKALPDAEMKKLIIANIKVGDMELQQLALQRAAAVQKYLITNGKLESQRLFQKQDNIRKPPKHDNSPLSRVELTPNVQ